MKETPPSKAVAVRQKLVRDLIFVTVSFIAAWWLAVSGVVGHFVGAFQYLGIPGIFLAGIGLSSSFISVPATVAIFLFARVYPFWLVAIVASLGAMAGDWFMFQVLRDGLGEDVQVLIAQSGTWRRFSKFFRSRKLTRFSYFIAVLILVSPIPDEVGLTLLSRLGVRTRSLLPFLFALNFLGIFIITLLARA